MRVFWGSACVAQSGNLTNTHESAGAHATCLSERGAVATRSQQEQTTRSLPHAVLTELRQTIRPAKTYHPQRRQPIYVLPILRNSFGDADEILQSLRSHLLVTKEDDTVKSFEKRMDSEMEGLFWITVLASH